VSRRCRSAVCSWISGRRRASQQDRQLLGLGVGQRTRGRVNDVGKVRQHLRIQHVRLGQLAEGAREVPYLARIDHRHRQSRRSQSGDRWPLPAAGGFQHDQLGRKRLQAPDPLLEAGGVGGRAPLLAAGADRNIQLGLGDIDANGGRRIPGPLPGWYQPASPPVRPWAMRALVWPQPLFGLVGDAGAATRALFRARSTQGGSAYRPPFKRSV